MTPGTLGAIVMKHSHEWPRTSGEHHDTHQRTTRRRVTAIRPLAVDFPDSDVGDLKARIENSRLPEAELVP